MTWWEFLAAWTLAAIPVARSRFGRLRAHSIARLGVEKYSEEQAARDLLWALFMGAVWPFTIAVRFIIWKPPVTPQELKLRDEIQRQRIKDLEQANEELEQQLREGGMDVSSS